MFIHKSSVGPWVGLFFSFALFSTPVIAEERSASARAFVYVDVIPNVTVSVLSSNLDLGNLRGGQIKGDLFFRVDSNVSRLSLNVAVTKLYKGGDPNATAVAPIDVDTSQPAIIHIEQGYPLYGASNKAACNEPTSVATPKGVMSGYRCTGIAFESSQIWRFSQNIDIEMNWRQTSARLPIGQYSGYVVLHAAILD